MTPFEEREKIESINVTYFYGTVDEIVKCQLSPINRTGIIQKIFISIKNNQMTRTIIFSDQSVYE
jgi:hypothetical protein